MPSITYDDVRPAITSLTIESDNWNTLPNKQYVAKVGDNITLKFKLPSNLRNNHQLSIGQRNANSYNRVSLNALGANEYSATYQMTNSDLEGMLDFELYFQDKSGNFIIQRQKSKITNNCFVASNLTSQYHASSSSDCNSSEWKKLSGYLSSTVATSHSFNIDDPSHR